MVDAEMIFGLIGVLALQADVTLKTVSEQPGHRTTGIRVDIYSHLTPEMAGDAVEKVSALIVGS
jgi:hypothetical protein